MHIATVVMNHFGREFFLNLYGLHRRLVMAFPTEDRRQRDPLNLDMFLKDHFAVGLTEKQRRTDKTNFLYRIDPLASERYRITMQSAMKPDLAYAFSTIPNYVLEMQVEPLVFNYKAGDKIDFCVRMQPLNRLLKSDRLAGKKKHLVLPTAEACELLKRKLAFGCEASVVREVRRRPIRVSKRNVSFHILVCDYVGSGVVKDPEQLQGIAIRGLGTGKMWGNGMLLMTQKF